MFDQKKVDEHQVECDGIRKGLLDGPWKTESDRKLFKHKGLDCLIVRSQVSFSWCGYVGLPPGHKHHKKHYEDVDVEVNGGLTYSEECSDIICHAADPGEPDELWWLGFDCSHSFDLSPGMDFNPKYTKLLGIPPWKKDAHYWTEEEVIAETKSLANQLQ